MKLLLENWRGYLEEIEEVDPIPGLDTPAGVQDSIDYFWFEHATNMEKTGKANREQLSEWGGFQMVRFNLPGEEAFYFLMDNDIPKAYIAVESYENGIKIGNVRKAPTADFYMSDLYKWLIDQHGSLYSDATQTPQGKRIWTYLREDPELNVEKVDALGGLSWAWKATKK